MILTLVDAIHMYETCIFQGGIIMMDIKELVKNFNPEAEGKVGTYVIENYREIAEQYLRNEWRTHGGRDNWPDVDTFINTASLHIDENTARIEGALHIALMRAFDLAVEAIFWRSGHMRWSDYVMGVMRRG